MASPITLPAWASHTDVEVRAICTRFVDPANNSDKYRWFFGLYKPGASHTHAMLITQTGRWTYMHSESNPLRTLHKGAVRVASTNASISAYRRAGNNGAQWTEDMAQRKLGGYLIVNKLNLDGDVFVKKLQSLGLVSQVGPGAPHPQAAQQSAPTNPPMQAMVANTQSQPPSATEAQKFEATMKALTDHLDNKIVDARSGSIDQIEAFRVIGTARSFLKIAEQQVVELNTRIGELRSVALALD